MKVFRIIDSFEPSTRWYLRAPKKSEESLIPDSEKIEDSWRNEVEGWHFASGKPFKSEGNLVIPIRTGSVVLDFTLGSMDMPVVKSSIAARLKYVCGDSIQWISVAIPGAGFDFEIANVLKLLDALDEERSEITPWTKDSNWPERAGQIAGVGKIVIKSAMLKDATLFRLTRWDGPLLATEEIKTLLEAMKVTGIKFQEIDQS